MPRTTKSRPVPAHNHCIRTPAMKAWPPAVPSATTPEPGLFLTRRRTKEPAAHSVRWDETVKVAALVHRRTWLHGHGVSLKMQSLAESP